MILYLDTSSLVKLYVLEDGSAEVRELVGAASLVATSVLAYAEARSAFARRCRERSLSAQEHVRVAAAFDAEWPRLLSLEVSQAIARHAGDLAERHALRAFDALHLASYVALAARIPEESFRFSSFDQRLTAAAEAETR